MTDYVYRVIVGAVGLAVVGTGLVMVPFPGPGWAVVIVGLIILATEFTWAQRLLAVVRRQVLAWTSWIGRRGWPVRIAVGAGTALCVALALYLVAVIFGVPGWVPDGLIPALPGIDTPR